MSVEIVFKLTFIPLFFFLLAFSCRIPHPPEFRHFIENESLLDLEELNEEELSRVIQKNTELTKALQFTEKEMKILKATLKPHLMTAAGIQARKNDFLGTEILELASDIENPKGFATVSLIERYFDIMYENKYESSLVTSLKKNIMKLQQNPKDNALFYYLYAYIQQKDMGDDEAVKQLQKGNTITHFNSYSKQRYQAIVEASEMVGYSKFTARVYAMPNFVPGNIYMRLFDLCRNLIAGKQSEIARKECQLMGKKIEAVSQNNTEKLYGLAFQGMRVKDSLVADGSKSKAEIERKRQEIINTISRMSKIPLNAMPEDFWIQYYQIFFEKNEEAATRFVEEYVKQHESEK